MPRNIGPIQRRILDRMARQGDATPYLWDERHAYERLNARGIVQRFLNRHGVWIIVPSLNYPV